MDELEDPVYREIFEAARPYLQTRKNEVHTRICVGFAQRLLREEGGDAQVAVPAAILHDVGWSRVPESLQLAAFGPGATRPDLVHVHEKEGAAIAREILAKVGYPPDETDAIVEIVSRHDTDREAHSTEEAVVKDADKLWRYSRTGFATDAERFAVTPAAHLAAMERAMGVWFLTPAARRLARAEWEDRRRELGEAAAGREERRAETGTG